MKVAVISSRTSQNTADLVAACERHSVPAAVYQLKELVTDTASFDDSEFMSHDAYIFRGYNRSYAQAQSLAQYLAARGKLVIDRQLTGGFIPSKFHEALTYRANGIAHPRTVFVRDAESEAVADMGLPVVVKDVDSQKGQGVSLCRSIEDLRAHVAERGQSIIIQEFIPMEYDIRVLCVGNEILGAIRRDVLADDFRSNVSLGSVATPFHLDADVSALALQAHAAIGYDVSGVDIGLGKDCVPFVIETNVTPEWQGFRKATGVDVADHIVRYVIERYEHER